MICFNCILDRGYFHGGIAKSHFCLKSEVGADLRSRLKINDVGEIMI